MEHVAQNLYITACILWSTCPFYIPE